jgi:hypothetical protein
MELEVLLLTAFHDLESVSVCDLLASTGYLCLQGTTEKTACNFREYFFMQKNYGRFSTAKFVKALSTFSETSEKGFGDIESVLYSEVSLIRRCPS